MNCYRLVIADELSFAKTHAHFAGDVTRVTDAKIAVYSCPFDSMATETKGTVLLKSASELLEFSKGEEELIEQVTLCRHYIIHNWFRDCVIITSPTFVLS